MDIGEILVLTLSVPGMCLLLLILVRVEEWLGEDTNDGKHSPHVLRVICGSGSAALYGEIACAGGCQGVPSMRSHRTAKAFLPCLRAVSM